MGAAFQFVFLLSAFAPLHVDAYISLYACYRQLHTGKSTARGPANQLKSWCCSAARRRRAVIARCAPRRPPPRTKCRPASRRWASVRPPLRSSRRLPSRRLMDFRPTGSKAFCCVQESFVRALVPQGLMPTSCSTAKTRPLQFRLACLFVSPHGASPLTSQEQGLRLVECGRVTT